MECGSLLPHAGACSSITKSEDMRDNLFVPGKMSYARGVKRPDVECILCAIVDGSDQVVRLDV